MIKKLLIANRGEIVARIIKTCREMGIATVAVYSEADKDAAFVQEADQALGIGPANPVQSYLNIEAIVEAALASGADAVHPGYGFLSERGSFARAVEDAGLAWVGPSPRVLAAISSKCRCRHLAREVEVPVIPGTLDPVPDAETVAAWGREHGWPLFLKLDKGGGGKGIEMVAGEKDAAEVFKRASSIGNMAFGSPDCYIEEVVDRPRHIEVQFLADTQGNVVCLGERECSVQRRHQKIIEEAPSVVVTDDDRAKLFRWTADLVRHMGYHGAGTIEGLRSGQGDYYFMEINARLQVEHPVSEMITGRDIVRHQLEIAAGQELDYSQEDVALDGHAVEARVYAEDPETFVPSPGVIQALGLPETGPNLRIDHALAPGISVPPYYDPLLAKVIAWDSDRPSAVARLARAMEGFRVEGVSTSAAANLRILRHPRFVQGDIDTGFIGSMLEG
jgi:acetyl-CoA carboxylase biotin carboxylase subunit